MGPEQPSPPPPKSDAYFHGMSSLSLPSLPELGDLDTEAQHKYLKRVAKQCEKVINLLDDSLSKFERREGALTIEEQITADMARLKKLPIAKQYREMTLWRRVRQFNEARLSAAEEVGYGRGLVESSGGNELLQHQTGDTDERFTSYKEAYLSDTVNRFQTDLDKMRETEGLDEKQTKFLLSCLEAGGDLFANVRCLEDKEKHNSTRLS